MAIPDSHALEAQSSGLSSGPTGPLPPAHRPQVFGTNPEEHAEAIERVRKAKVRLRGLTSCCSLGQGTGWGWHSHWAA